MSVRSRCRARIAAAFWLLAAAWLCANVRPDATGAFLSWLSEASTFSHQQRLTSQVAELLGGEKTAATVAKSEPAPKRPTKPAAALPDTTFKKLEVPLTQSAHVVERTSLPVAFPIVAEDMRGRERAAPPHGPPRRASVS